VAMVRLSKFFFFFFLISGMEIFRKCAVFFIILQICHVTTARSVDHNPNIVDGKLTC